MASPRLLLFVGLGVLVVAAVVLVLLRDDGKRAELLKAPGLDLVYVHGTLLREQLPSGSFGGAGSYLLRYYGTDHDGPTIAAWYDAELAKLGYAAVPPTRDEQLFSQDQDKLFRQYQNGPFTYRLYLLPLPFRITTQWLRSGYRHVLCAKLSN